MPKPTAPTALACALAAGLLTAAAPAGADHSRDERVTDDTPYILRPGEVRLGLWKTEVGLFGHPLLRNVEIGTDHLPWLLSLTEARSYNGHLRLRLHQGEHFALSAGAGHTYLGFAMEDSDVSLRITPITVAAGWRFDDRFTLTSNLVHTRVSVKGTMNDTAEIDALWGAVGSSTTQVRSNLEIRLTEHTALLLGARVIAGQTLHAAAGGSEQVGDDTTAGGQAMVETTAIDMRGDVTGRLAFHWSWSSFNLRAGVQYGSPSIPGINLAVPARSWMPSLDFYWRF